MCARRPASVARPGAGVLFLEGFIVYELIYFLAKYHKLCFVFPVQSRSAVTILWVDPARNDRLLASARVPKADATRWRYHLAERCLFVPNFGQ